jgi:hypothetical protein
MTVFKLSKEVFDTPWDYDTKRNISPPLTEDWHNTREITVDDVSIWEQIYHEPGNIGIYAAYCPYAEFYIFVFEQFLKTKYEIRSFHNTELVYQESLKFGIRLDSGIIN